MNLAIVGYGKMGKLIEQLAPDYDFAVHLTLDEFNNTNFEGITRENFRNIEVAMDFSIPSTAVENIERISALGVNLVVGTTGWLERLEHVKSVVEKSGNGLVWSPNFSIGVNAFMRLVSQAAQLLANETEYVAWGYEVDDATMKDVPSGALLTRVEQTNRAGKRRPY